MYSYVVHISVCTTKNYPAIQLVERKSEKSVVSISKEVTAVYEAAILLNTDG